MSLDAPGTVPGQEPSPVRILIDSPSVHPSLGFGATASALARIIIDSPPRFAVGIFGDWGSGKTTLMEEIRRWLLRRTKSTRSACWPKPRPPSWNPGQTW
jgi:hypothetical protein